ncbi:MAG: ATP-binding cassette domain-containing protein, partial [Desulfovibrio fairfieldensis]|nr:ATP-binding cassette domain-containing protein [Desulfovibrio fairfieldensis]
YPGTLSVGERQRVAIARALAHGPGVVLADEPTAALDPWHARNVLNLFTDLTRELGITMIMVTHAPDMAADVGFTLVHFAVESGPDGVVADVRHKAGRG